MTEEKKNPNPFINMANEAKKNSPRLPNAKTSQQKAPKPSKGFGGASVVRRTGRGG
jgi:hypothetical protein